MGLGVNDHGGFCECDSCAPLLGRERNRTGQLNHSELYYTWVNRVVEKVAEEHPDKYFGLLAYRETVEPPSFKLHENVVPYITLDYQSCMDPDVRAGWIETLAEWSRKAKYLGQWEYGYGALFYKMPRVYFELQREMMREVYEHGVRAMYVETSTAIDTGPKLYLYHKFLWDIDADLDELLDEWYVAAVGEEAAPYLAEYYRTWEEIWEKAAETDWFRSSKNSVYLNLSNRTYLYAPDREDMVELRRLMERVFDLTERYGDERQKIRAGWIMREFEYSEANVYAFGGDRFPPSGEVDADAALAYLENLSEAIRYDERRVELHDERSADPDIARGGLPVREPEPYVPTALSQIAVIASRPEVMEAFKASSNNPDIPGETRGLLDILARLEAGEEINNLLEDGSFESGSAADWFRVRVTSRRAYSGENAVKFNLRPPIWHMGSRHHRDHKIEVGPGWHLASAMVYVEQEHADVEQYVHMTASAVGGGERIRWWRTPRISVPPNEWTRISLVANVTGDRNRFGIDYIHFAHYTEDDTAFIDDIVVAPLER